MGWIEKGWYQGDKRVYLLLPLMLVFYALSRIRVALFKLGLKRVYRSKVPVIIVGNISVGGTGKTPFTLYLINILRQYGLTPGVVSRGYGAIADDSHPFPRRVTQSTPVSLSGDEAKLIALKSGCPVVISPNRVDAVKLLENQCDIIISDDGLQHYAMARDVELVLIDGERQFGNGCLLPVGPLRESKARLNNVDMSIVNRGSQKGEDYWLAPGDVYQLTSPTTVYSVQKIMSMNRQIVLMSGIGNPERFQQTVESLGLEISDTIWFADHYKFTQDDFATIRTTHPNAILLMTEKDAVKCTEYADEHCFVLPIQAHLSDKLESELMHIINHKCRTF